MPDIANLLQQLTLDEKISLLAGANFWETVPIPRLGIPALKTSDGPNGVRGQDISGFGPTAACFPAAVAIAASFDHSIAHRVGKALAEETKSKGASVLLAPTVCPHRAPRGGRNFESFSEDPLLAGNLATHLINGLQENGIGATIKHFAANETETRRHFINTNADERTLREIYMKPFEIAIKAAKPWAVMTSYNLVNGVHADMSEFLLRKVLREEWKFEGLVMSDWGGTNSVAASINAGLDLEMPGPASKRKLDAVKAALKTGELSQEAIDASTTKILELLVKAGKFENPAIAPEQSIISPEHSSLIREAGGKGLVLLKNDKNTLPLSKDKIKSIAAVGFAKDCLAHGGGSAMVNCHYRATPYEALERLFKGSVDIKYAKGAHTMRNLPNFTNIFDLSGQPGLTLSKYDSTDFESTPKSSGNTPSGTFTLFGEPCAGLKFEGHFQPTESGSHYISINGLGPTKLYINDELVLSSDTTTDIMGVLLGGSKDNTCQYKFDANERYKLRLETVKPETKVNDGLSDIIEGVLATRLGFVTQQEYEADLLTEAVEIAKDADVVIAFVGNPSVWETEGRDQTDMHLPDAGSQDRLITALAKVNPNVVVVNSTGSPVAMPWLGEVSAVVQSWFGGQESGNSIVDVLFGDVNPGGKLPVSFPKTEEQSVTYGNFPGDPETDQIYYREGIKIGYRYYDEHPENVAFPFGFGLSYTTFELGESSVTQNGSSITVKVKVKNTGDREGSEVVQVYIGSPVKTVDVPVKELAAYVKVTIPAGGEEEVELQVEDEKLAYWDVKTSTWAVEKGEYKVFVGNSSVAVKDVGRFAVESSRNFGP